MASGRITNSSRRRAGRFRTRTGTRRVERRLSPFARRRPANGPRDRAGRGQCERDVGPRPAASDALAGPASGPRPGGPRDDRAAAAACGAPQGPPVRSADPAVRRAEANVASARASPAGYRGPARGPRAQRGGLIVFVAGDLTNGGIAGAAPGGPQGAAAVGWGPPVLHGPSPPPP